MDRIAIMNRTVPLRTVAQRGQPPKTSQKRRETWPNHRYEFLITRLHLVYGLGPTLIFDRRPSKTMIKPVQPGDQLDHYQIDDLVARGGMACIYRGTDSRTGQPVAIKVPNPEMEADVLFFDRFHREADIGRKLDHPGVVKVLPSEDPSRVYMALEWVEGRPLREILDKSKKLSPERAGRIATRICDALGYIHSQGIVHR